MRQKLFALIVLGITACAMPVAAETVRVNIDNLKFSPAEIPAHVGDNEWISTDFVAHTARAHNRDWDIAISAKGTGRVTLQHAGEVGYFCRFHPNMMGRILVAPE